MQKFLFVVCVILVAALTACNVQTSMVYTFKVGTGDSVEIKLNTANGHKLTQEDGKFAITDEDGNKLMQGVF